MSTGSACECRGTNNFCSYCQPERTHHHVATENEKLKERVQELEEALTILNGVSCHWNLHVSQDDEFLVDRVLAEIKAKS